MPDEIPPNEGKEPPKEQLPATSTPLFAANEKIQKINVADEIKNSFLDYSMSVIISRALPDARDGLKPSQRRILFAMQRAGRHPTASTVKCAKIVAATPCGNYHPHGEVVIYPTLVHMAQPWAMREMLVDGQGNFGSVEGDPPAAMRYTEARLTHLGAILMEDMDKDTVNFVPNYDETPHWSQPSSPPPFPISSSMAAPASPSAWPPTWPRTIWAKSSTASARRSTTRHHRRGIDAAHQRPRLSHRLHGLRPGRHQGIFRPPAAAASKSAAASASRN
jgi:hypothetical protein